MRYFGFANLLAATDVFLAKANSRNQFGICGDAGFRSEPRIHAGFARLKRRGSLTAIDEVDVVVVRRDATPFVRLQISPECLLVWKSGLQTELGQLVVEIAFWPAAVNA
jgi:hypothetical protein